MVFDNYLIRYLKLYVDFRLLLSESLSHLFIVIILIRSAALKHLLSDTINFVFMDNVI